MKKLIFLLALIIISCDNDEPLQCDCNVEISGYFMDYNVKPYTGVVTEYTGMEETDITDCNMDGEEIFNNHGRVGTLRCK